MIEMMPEIKNSICQSCGMPITIEEFYGTNEDGSKNKDYCSFCYQNGRFTEPKLTKKQMIKKVSKFYAKVYPKHIARKMAEDTIKNLKRWRDK